MLSSRKALEPRSLHDSTTRNILLSQSRTTHHPPSSLFSFHREFSWGSKHKNPTSRAGKVCKGFSTQDSAGKDTTHKQLYRSTLWGNQHLRQYLPRYAPIQEWRYASSWGKNPETPASSRDRPKVDEKEDWYTRWEKQKLRQYDDFMKKVGQDPYTALFGKNWLSFSWENTEPKVVRTQSPNSPKETSAPKNERTPNHWPSKSKSSSTNLSENGETVGRLSKSERMPVEEYIQEYEIDPITNRKVLRSSASPSSAAGHINVEHAQAFSSSSPLNRDIPFVKSHNGSGWLAQEGFGNCREPVADSRPILQSHDAKSSTTAAKIESALDRHLSNKSTNEKGKNDRPKLQYKPEEVKTEDVDLLRPSDVRASAGLRGNSPKETDVDKQARRQKLEENYESCSLDRESQLAREAAVNHFLQERENRPVESSKSPEPRFGSWSKLQDAKLKDKEASKDTSAVWVNELSDVRDCDPVSVDQTPISTPLRKTSHLSVPLINVAPRAHAETRDKASILKARIMPFKVKLDAMKAEYDSLRQRWLQEVRRAKEKAAKKEAEMKAQRVAKMAGEMHEEEIKTQKDAMEAMEMRSSHGSINTAKTGLAKGVGNDDGEKPTPRRLQSFLQGEGDMASNVHEFAGRDRWYKRKAPHAMDEKDAEMDAKLQKLARDRALIREVRDIYEDTYGTIDTKHRQIHVLDSTRSTNRNSETATTSSGKVGLHVQLPSISATESSQGLYESQSSEAMKIIQKLFGHLREVQSIVQDFRCQAKQDLSPGDPKVNALKTPDAVEKSLMQMVRTSEQLARIKSAGMIERGFVGAITHGLSIPLVSKSTKLELQNATKPSTYCILAYDLATQNVKSAEVTTLEHFSKEESLLPLDALSRLNNPGKFLPHVISLGHQGYKPVSATSNIAVFKKEITLKEKVEINKTDAKKEPIPIRSLPDHSAVISDDAIGNRDGNWPFNPISEEQIEEYRPEQLQGHEAEQQKVTEAQKEAVDNNEKEDRKKAMDSMQDKKQSFQEAQTQKSASSASPNYTSSDRVRRQETVFSGSRQGRWTDNGIKPRKSKRAVDRRRKTMKRMLMAGGFTAACCYCVGVASEMIHT